MADSTKIHFGYIVAILVGIIIALMTVEWGGIRDLVNYIGFALTLTSLVLALLAIIYSYFSNATFGQNISTLNAASQQMSRSASELGAATVALRDRVDDIPGALETMGRSFEETRGVIASLAERTAAQTAPSSEQEKNEDDPLREQVAERFLKNSPLSGQLALYAASRAATLDRPLNLTALSERVQYMTRDYTLAFILAAEIAGVIERGRGGPDALGVKSVDPLITTGVRDRVFQVAAELDSRKEATGSKYVRPFAEIIGDIVATLDAVVEGRTLPPIEEEKGQPGGSGASP